MAKIKEFIQDDRNFNKGTTKGSKLMEKSLTELGAGRSILVDKNNRIIAGNKTQLAAIKAGIEEAVVVETTGDRLVVVKRTDLDIDSKKGRELALADNKTTEVNLEWDEDAMKDVADSFGIDFKEWGVSFGDFENNNEPKEVVEDAYDESCVNDFVNRGDIWQLGEHRLMCGDSTSTKDVTKLMGGVRQMFVLLILHTATNTNQE